MFSSVNLYISVGYQLAFCLIEFTDQEEISVDDYLEILSLSMELVQQNKPTEIWPGNCHWEDEEERVRRRPWYRYDYELKNTVFWLYVACQVKACDFTNESVHTQKKDLFLSISLRFYLSNPRKTSNVFINMCAN